MGNEGAWPLIGRDEELDLLATAPGATPSSIVVAGPAGVGKSRLVAAYLDMAAAGGATTVLVRATRSTATIPFGPFAPWAPDGSNGATADRLQVLRSISAALVDETTHVVVAVDDAHLLDEGSAALLLHLVADTPARVVATVRSGEPCPDAVVSLWKEGLAERADLQPLSEIETIGLLEQALGGTVDPTAAQRVWALTRGTPLYVREVVRASLTQGVLVNDRGRWLWHGSLTGSTRLLELMGEHLGQVDPDERHLLDLLAVGEPLPLRLVTRLGHIAAVAALEAQGLVTVDGGRESDEVRLAHPLYGEVLRTAVTALAAREHHRVLAAAALAIGWHDREPLRVAVWCLEGGETPDTPGMLVAASRRALALSEWELADRLSRAAGTEPQAILTRAIALTPLVRWDESVALLADLAVESLAGEIDETIAGEAARVHSWLLFWRPGADPTVADVRAAADRLPAPVRSLALVHSAFQALLAARPSDAARLAEGVMAAEATASGTTEPADLHVQALSVLAFARGTQGRTAEALAAAGTGLPRVAAILERDPVPGNPAGAMPPAFCLALVLDGRLAEAYAVAEIVLQGLDDGGARAMRALAATLAGRMALFRGRLDDARRLAELGLSICRETQQLPASHWPAAVLASAAAQQGDGATAQWALDWAAESSSCPPLYGVETDQACAWSLAAKGRLSAARAQLATTADRAAAAGLHAMEVLALVDLARLGAPEAAVERVDALTGRTGRTGVVDGRFATAVAGYVHAGVVGDAEALARASADLESIDALLLAAEAAAGAAAAFDADGRHSSAAAARGRARVLAARCGGPRTPALCDLGTEGVLATLTDREREVAGLAARGLTNREIAEGLYVSVRTVNTHLYRVYAKLGVNDRAQLGPLLAPHGDVRSRP